MSKIYGIIGTSQQIVIDDTVQYTPLKNEVIMEAERPSVGEYIATSDGHWVKSKEEQIATLDRQYEADKKTLQGYYLEFSIAGNTAGMEAIKQEMTDLAEQYDADLAVLKGGE